MRRSRDNGGFVLFEVLVSVVILSAGCVALVKSLSISMRTFQLLEDRYVAVLALEDAAWTMDRSGGVFDPLQYQSPERFQGVAWTERQATAAVGDSQLNAKTMTIQWKSPIGPDETFALSAYYRPNDDSTPN